MVISYRPLSLRHVRPLCPLSTRPQRPEPRPIRDKGGCSAMRSVAGCLHRLHRCGGTLIWLLGGIYIISCVWCARIFYFFLAYMRKNLYLCALFVCKGTKKYSHTQIFLRNLREMEENTRHTMPVSSIDSGLYPELQYVPFKERELRFWGSFWAIFARFIAKKCGKSQKNAVK